MHAQGPARTSRKSVKVSDVLIGEADWLQEGSGRTSSSRRRWPTRVFTWLRPRCQPTLNAERPTRRSRPRSRPPRPCRQVHHDLAAASMLAKAGKPLDDDDIDLLRLEHQRLSEPAGRSASELAHSLAVAGHVRGPVRAVRRVRAALRAQAAGQPAAVATTLALVVVTVGLAVLAPATTWRAELVPLLRVRHDAVDRLSPGVGPAVFGRA